MGYTNIKRKTTPIPENPTPPNPHSSHNPCRICTGAIPAPLRFPDPSSLTKGKYSPHPPSPLLSFSGMKVYPCTITPHSPRTTLINTQNIIKLIPLLSDF